MRRSPPTLFTVNFRAPALGVAAIALLMACDRPAGRETESRAARAATVTPAYLDSAEGCEFLRARANPDPKALVAEYVRRDAEGAFLETNRWLDTAYLCPGHLPGPDEFTAIAGSHLVEIDRSDSLARFTNASDALGAMTQDSLGFVFAPNKRTTVDTFVVRRTAFGWRIEEPALPDRVSSRWVLSHAAALKLRRASLDSLRALSLGAKR